MKNFVKIFLSIFLSVFLLSSCIGKNPGEGQVGVTGDVSESGKAIELPGENANFVFKIDGKNADFLLGQYKKLLSLYAFYGEEYDTTTKKVEDIIDKLKNSSLEFVLLTDGLMKNYYNNEAVSMLFSNLDKDIISFTKDVKLGFAEKDIKDAKEMYKILSKKETLAEILASGKDIGKSLKKQATDSGKENLERTTKVINSMEIGSKNVLVSVPAFNSPDLKLTGKLKDNKGFVELIKNLKGNELLYIYAAGNNSEEALKSFGQIDLKPKNILIGTSIEKTGINVNIYIKTNSKITEEQSKKFKKDTEEINKNFKASLAIWLAQIEQMLENKEDKEFIKSAVDSLNIKYTKLSEDIFSININLTTDLEKVFNIIEKSIKKAQENFKNNVSEMSTGEDNMMEEK